MLNPNVPEENRKIWCICCNQLVPVGHQTMVMKTVTRLTPTGPVSYGRCDACATHTTSCRNASEGEN